MNQTHKQHRQCHVCPSNTDKDIHKGLSDRLYDKRKAAALELERVIRKSLADEDRDRIRAILDTLCREFAYAVHHPNARNGGLIGLAAATIALGQVEVATYLDDIIHPVLACFGDQDARVRYFACESMYNIAKVAKGEILIYFNEIFDVLCRLSADSDQSVRSGAELLDRLVKDIVSEKAATYVSLINPNRSRVPDLAPNPDPTKPTIAADTLPASPLVTEGDKVPAFSLAKFIPLLQERIYVIDPSTRMFLVLWIGVLDSIPDLELVTYLPNFLAGFMLFLSDPSKEVRNASKNVLDGFLQEIKRIHDIKETLAAQRAIRKSDDKSDNSPLEEDMYIPGQDTVIDYPRIVETLLTHLTSDPDIQIAVLIWIESLLDISPMSLLQYAPKLLSVLLPTMANDDVDLKSEAERVNAKLQKLILSLDDDANIDYSAMVNALTLHFLNEQEQTREAALEWLIMLHRKAPTKTLNDGTFPALLKTLSDPSELVITKDLQLLAQISHSSDDSYFSFFMTNLVQLFSTDRRLLETRGNLIIRQLCVSLNPERIYRALAEILEKDEDKEFACIMVQNLGSNLIIAPEMAELRQRLRKAAASDTLFITLFKCWCHDAVSAFSLCLLAQAYEQAYTLLQLLAEFDITVNLLVQIDKLILLLESPVFTHLRLQLLEPDRYPYLYKCLYGLLMILPQSTAFNTLHNRLNSVSSLQASSRPSQTMQSSSRNDIKWNELMDTFKQVQLAHQKLRRESMSEKFVETTSSPVIVCDHFEGPAETSSPVENKKKGGDKKFGKLLRSVDRKRN